MAGKSKRQKEKEREMERCLKEVLKESNLKGKQPKPYTITYQEALAAMDKFGYLQFAKGSEFKKAAFAKIQLALSEFYLEAARIGKRNPAKKGTLAYLHYVRKEYNKALNRAFKKIVLTN